WMHNGFVRVDEEKMSKSLGNFFTVREVLKKYHPETIRFFILTSHYRSPLNYSDEQLNDAGMALTRLYTALRDVEVKGVAVDGDYEQRFKKAMDDDFNTPIALSVLFDCARELNKIKDNDSEKALILATTLKSLAEILGILQRNPKEALQTGFHYSNAQIENASVGLDTKLVLSDDEIEQQINDRLDAKKNKDWASADKIRDQLKQQGIVLEDVSDGTNWRRE
ncbi:MAG: class I tRNA ligase family protein, partial [Methylococcales bacterium]|nr:class I tRNA ligase family protein [Methylococcales bacterium]